MSSDLISNEMVINNIKCDFVNYLLEDAYKDKLKFNLFFDELVNVYESGHIPCGWDGEWPEGNLVIYWFIPQDNREIFYTPGGSIINPVSIIKSWSTINTRGKNEHGEIYNYCWLREVY